LNVIFDNTDLVEVASDDSSCQRELDDSTYPNTIPSSPKPGRGRKVDTAENKIRIKSSASTSFYRNIIS